MKQPEQLARETIDASLAEAGWIVQDREAMNVAAGVGVAIREFKTNAGFADYLLYVDKKPAGVIEAKKEGVVLTSIEAQTKDYASKVPAEIPVPIRPLPFLYESTGVETRFTNLLDPTPRSRRVFQFHRPDTLKEWLDAAIAIQTGRPDAPIAATFLGRIAAPCLSDYNPAVVSRDDPKDRLRRLIEHGPERLAQLLLDLASRHEDAQSQVERLVSSPAQSGARVRRRLTAFAFYVCRTRSTQSTLPSTLVMLALILCKSAPESRSLWCGGSHAVIESV